jgi:hypothetical protein
MKRKKPIALLIFGILNLVFGGINLVMHLCCGVVAAGLFFALSSLYQQVPPQDQKELEGLWQAFSNNVPGLIPFVIASLVVSLILGLMQLVSGIGLVKIQNWGRWLCAVWGVLEVVTVSASLFYSIAILSPGMEKAVKDLDQWAEKMEQRQRKAGQAPPPRQKFTTIGSGNVLLDNAVSIMMSVLNIGYGLAAFIFMVLPQTSQAIARYNAPAEELPPERTDDYYDEEFQRRRRLEELPPDPGGPPADAGPRAY